MCDRVSATTQLLLMIKCASVELSRGLPKDSKDMMQDKVLRAGMHALESLGVSRDEIVKGTINLVYGSPTVRDVNHDPAVSTRD